MELRNFLRTVDPRTNNEDAAQLSSGSPTPAEDALMILADIIEDMLDEASGAWRPVSGADGMT